MKLPDKKAVLASLPEMVDELNAVKVAAEEFSDDIGDLSPEDMNFDIDKEDFSEDDKEKIKEIKTPEDAKKVLELCKDDIDNVINSLDGLAGQASEEVEASKHKRFNEKYASSIVTLAQKADKAINDANSAMQYWGYLRKAKRVQSSSTSTKSASSGDSLDKAFSQVEKSMNFLDKLADKLGYIRKSSNSVTATAVPPTGAKFTGDKFENGKNPAEIELRHWHAGEEKGNRDKAFEDARPNAATDHRLDTEEYPRSDSPFVNASFHFIDSNKFGSYWEVVDSKTGSKLIADFANLPSDIGVKNDKTFKEFSSKSYGNRIITAIKTNGLEKTQKELNAKISKLDKETLEKVASDKSTLRSYYTDAYGDSGYANSLVAGSNKEMNIGYTPKDNSVSKKDTSTKDGTGKISRRRRNRPVKEGKRTDDIEILNAKARRSVTLARKFASRGAIPFTYDAIKAKAAEILKLSDAEYQAKDEALNDIPIVNEAALKEAHIPETEVGIVGNTSQGVRDQASKVNTEDINSNVKRDATINKNASLVPQTPIDNSKSPFTYTSNYLTIKERLQQKGVDVTNLKIAKRRY